MWSSFIPTMKMPSRLKGRQTSGAAVSGSTQAGEARPSHSTAVGRAQPTGYW